MGAPFDEPALRHIARLAPEPGTRGNACRMGLQPHAPYSAGRRVFAAATHSGLPLSTHLAESPAELEFVATGGGPFRALLQGIGKWDETFAADYNAGLTPVRWMKPHLEQAHWLCAHCNYVTDDDIDLLASTGASVAYCPRASEYFRHKPHRYLEMLDAGVNVCLGTDSIICHGTLSVLDEMRRLHRRDKTDPRKLLGMATVNGWKALGVDAALPWIGVRYDPSEPGDALAQVLRSREPADIQWVHPTTEP